MGGAGEITITRMYDMRKESMVNKTKKALSGGGGIKISKLTLHARVEILQWIIFVC